MKPVTIPQAIELRRIRIGRVLGELDVLRMAAELMGVDVSEALEVRGGTKDGRKRRRPMTPAEKRAVSEKMKKVWARRKRRKAEAERLAALGRRKK